MRAQIEELLRAGLSDRWIAGHVHTHRRKVRDLRAELGLPAHKPGPTPAATVEDLFWRRAQPTDDGHLLWPSYDPQHGATVRHDGRRQSAHRIAFRLGHDRDPVGQARTGCGRDGCVHPRHVEDQPMRDTYRAIFGTAA